MVQLGIYLLILVNVEVKLLGSGIWGMPQGNWARHRSAEVNQFMSGFGSEFGIGIGRALNFQLVGKYLPLNTGAWNRYARRQGLELESRAGCWALLSRLEIAPLVGEGSPVFRVGIGYFAPWGREWYYRPEYGETLSYPYTFLKKSPGFSIGVGTRWSPVKFLRLVPKVQYTAFAGIGYPGESPYTLASQLELGVSVERGVLGVGEAERLERELALRLKRKEEEASNSYTEQGIAFFGLGEYEKAITALDLALLWDPDNIRAEEWLRRAQRAKEDGELNAWLKRAREALDSGDYLEAIASSEKVLERDPEHIEAKHLKTRAMEMLDKAQCRTAEIGVHSSRGLEFYLAGDYAKAIAEWEAVLQLDPDNPEAVQNLRRIRARLEEMVTEWLTRAEGYMREEKWGAAIRQCELVLSQDPQNLRAQEIRRVASRRLEEYKEDLLQRGERLYRARKYIDAEATFLTLLRLDPKNAQAREWLERIRAQRRDVGKKMVSELYMKGVEFYTKEDFSTAIFYWTKVLELDPNHKNAQRNISRAQQKLKALKRAEE